MSEMDSVVYDMANFSKEQPSIFVAKQWVNLLDEQNSSYGGGQSILSTSAISNSSKYANWMESYIHIPILMTLTSTLTDATALQTATNGGDFAYGLKSNVANLIDSVSVEINNSQVVQMSKMIGVYNNFKLLTSLNWNDVHGGLCSSMLNLRIMCL
jgi:hypothetical protein